MLEVAVWRVLLLLGIAEPQPPSLPGGVDALRPLPLEHVPGLLRLLVAFGRHEDDTVALTERVA